MMMKGDVLSGFEELKVCTAYKYKGKEIKHLPYNIEPENVTPVYSTFPCWKEDLDQNERRYHNFLKNLMVTSIS